MDLAVIFFMIFFDTLFFKKYNYNTPCFFKQLDELWQIFAAFFG